MTTVMNSKWIRVTRNNPCPVCNKPDWCLVAQDGKVVICARIESDKPAGNKGAGWLHYLDSALPIPPLPKLAQDVKQPTKAAPDMLDTAHRALLSELALSETHRKNLQNRGLTGSEIHVLGYKTLPASGHWNIVKRLQAKGIKLAGVPGFYLEKGHWRFKGPAGIALPVRDTRKRVVGLQIRCDNTETGRYKWVSSKGYCAGCSPGVPVHVAGPPSANSEVWIVEGPIKADIVALKLNHLVLAVAGVGNWAGVIPIIRDLKPKRVIVAYDMDKISNPIVKLRSMELIACLINRGIRTFEADWDVHYKGLDDLLTGAR